MSDEQIISEAEDALASFTRARKARHTGACGWHRRKLVMLLPELIKTEAGRVFIARVRAVRRFEFACDAAGMRADLNHGCPPRVQIEADRWMPSPHPAPLGRRPVVTTGRRPPFTEALEES